MHITINFDDYRSFFVNLKSYEKLIFQIILLVDKKKIHQNGSPNMESEILAKKRKNKCLLLFHTPFDWNVGEQYPCFCLHMLKKIETSSQVVQ